MFKGRTQSSSPSGEGEEERSGKACEVGGTTEVIFGKYNLPQKWGKMLDFSGRVLRGRM